MLPCKVNPSIGFIIAGHQSMECRFVPSNNVGPPQAYQGALNTVGIDLGISAGGVLGWAVLAPTVGIPEGALAGEYVGASGDVGIGLGAGANILIGGSARTVALQPVSLEGSVAVNGKPDQQHDCQWQRVMHVEAGHARVGARRVLYKIDVFDVWLVASVRHA
jgi:hypothetical protein